MNVFELGRSHSSMFNFAAEMIEFQDDQFGHQLEGLFTEIKNTYVKPGISMPAAMADKYSVRMSKLIFSRFGLKCKVVYNEHMAAIMPLYANRNHIFLTDWQKGAAIEDQIKFLEKIKGEKGYIDLAKAKISGRYSEYEHVLYVNYDDFFSEDMLTPGQATGITLHEIGHAFYNISHSDRWHSSNQILADLALTTVGKKNTDRTHIYREIEKYNDKIKKEEIDKMMTGDPIVAGYIWHKYIAEGNFNTNGASTTVSTYDQTSCEQMADNFAARFGYGREVISGLEAVHKVYGSFNHSWYMAAWGMILEYAIIGAFNAVAIAMIMAAFSVATGGAVLLIYGIMIYIFTTAYVLSTGEAKRDYTYDELKFRYKRIRDQMVNRLKDKALDKAIVKKIIGDIAYTDNVIKGIYEDWSIYRVILNRVIPSNRAAKNAIEDEQLLETLAANAMFMKAAQIRTSV